MAWALELPTDLVPSPTARHVLLVLANYAGETGRGAFPAVATLARQTGLSERTVQSSLSALAEAQVIRPGNAAVAAAWIGRPDRRPKVWDLALARGAADAPREGDGVQLAQHGVQLTAERGAAAAPDPSSNRKSIPSARPADGRFEEFWALYPKKHAKKPCRAKWISRKLDARADLLIADVRNRVARDDAWLRGYAPDPLTYLNQDRWDDALRTAPQDKAAAPAAMVHATPEATRVAQQASKARNPLTAEQSAAKAAEARAILRGAAP